MWAVVPLKSPERAKSRLAGALSMAQRQRLLFELGKRVIDALHSARGIDFIAVVTASAEVAAFARTLGVRPILQEAETGTASAFAAALHELQPLQLESVLMIAGDLPLVTAAAIERVIAVCDSTDTLASQRSSRPVAGGETEWGHPVRQDAPTPTLAIHIPVQLQADAFHASALGRGKDTLGVLAETSCLSPRRPEEGARATAIIVPDRHRIGTNALLCSPPEIIPPCFGRDSFRRHLAAAENGDIRTHVLEIDELALDLDCAADLDELRLRSQSVAASIIELPIRRVAGVSR